MSDLEKALADIAEIRDRVAQSQPFRGFGPIVVAASGVIAIAAGLAQAQFEQLQSGPGWLLLWLSVAALVGVLVVGEMISRQKRDVFHLSNAALWAALERFMASLFAGAMLTLVLWIAGRDLLFLLPGLWALLISTAVFAAMPNLPRSVRLVGGWYLLTGLGVLLAALDSRAGSALHMVLPFGGGQLLMGILLAKAEGVK